MGCAVCAGQQAPSVILRALMRLIQSNRLEVLADALAEALRAAPFGPFDQPVVVVPSTLMERWLTLELVDRLGFLANVRFELPAVCAWRMMASVVPEVSADSPFAADALRWRLMGLLRQGTGVGTPVDQYLAGGGASGAALARYRLASELAALYEQYATYRSDWLEGWTRGAGVPFGDAPWQAPLWKKLVQRMPGVATRHPRHTFIDMLGRDVEALARLPCCLFLFNPDALPPVYLEIFAGVARHVPVSLYLFNPSQEYWTDVRRRDASLNARLTAGQGNAGDVPAKDGP